MLIIELNLLALFNDFNKSKDIDKIKMLFGEGGGLSKIYIYKKIKF
jgi:hypothetical protein